MIDLTLNARCPNLPWYNITLRLALLLNISNVKRANSQRFDGKKWNWQHYFQFIKELHCSRLQQQ